jgi:hypothetical protein
MNRGTKLALGVAAVAFIGLAVYWMASAKLMDWLLALHGQH